MQLDDLRVVRVLDIIAAHFCTATHPKNMLPFSKTYARRPAAAVSRASHSPRQLLVGYVECTRNGQERLVRARLARLEPLNSLCRDAGRDR